MTESTVTHASAYDDASPSESEEDFDDLEAPQGRRVPRLSILLGIVILLGGAFSGGVLTQKHHDKSLTAASSTAGRGAGGFPAGLGFGAAGGVPQTGTGGTAAGGGSTGTTSTTGTSGSTPVLVGTVVSSANGTVTVKDLGGKTHVVRTTTTTTVTTTTTGSSALGALKAGSTVSVSGTKSADGSVSASNLTSR